MLKKLLLKIKLLQCNSKKKKGNHKRQKWESFIHIFIPILKVTAMIGKVAKCPGKSTNTKVQICKKVVLNSS